MNSFSKNHFSQKLFENWHLIVTLVIAVFVRFSYRIPVLFLDDSSKYFAPLPILERKDFFWVLDTINFGLLNRVISYFWGLVDNNVLDHMISFEKILGVLSTILVYLICYQLSKNKVASALIAMVFSLNPEMLYMEQTIMPEALFLFFSILASYCLLKLLYSVKSFMRQSFYAIAFGLALALTAFSKQTGETWVACSVLAFFVVGILKFKETKNYFFLALIIASTVFAVRLPLILYNYNRHGIFSTNLYKSADGVVLWTLTEEILNGPNPPQKYPWLSQGIKYYTMDNRRKFRLATDAKDERSFFQAISLLNSAGRVGSLVNPVTQQSISSHEWSKICFEYWWDFSIRNPLATIKRIFLVSFKNIMLEPNLNLHFYIRSVNPQAQYEAVPFTIQPFSRNYLSDPELVHYQPILTNDLSEADFEVFSRAHEASKYRGKFFLMQARGSNIAYAIPEQGLSLFLQKYLRYVPFIYFIFPCFLYALFLRSKHLFGSLNDIDVFELYLLGSVCLYMLLPILISMGEPRYRLQFMPYLLIYSVYSIFGAKTPPENCETSQK